MKKCKTCNIEKELISFRGSKRHKDGLMSECKECVSIKRKKYFLENYERHRNNAKKYYEENKKEIYEKIDKEKKKINDRNYRKRNYKKLKEKKIEYYYKNRDKILEDRKEYYEENKDKLNKTNERKREIRRKSYRKRKYQYVWREILRKTISQLKLNKSQTTKEILGYYYDDLKLNIESKFEPGMSWDNHGEWHVDHIIPISMFKEGTSPMIVNRLDNLRPLWGKDNIKKSNKIDIEDKYKYLLEDFREFLVFVS